MASLYIKDRFHSLIAASILLLSAQSSLPIPAAKAAGPAPAAAAPQMQTLTFPDVQVATFEIFVPTKDKQGKAANVCTKYLARGKIKIPGEGAIHVFLKYDGLEHLDTLAQIAPSRVLQLSAPSLDLDDKGLKLLTRFTSIFRVNLDSTNITDKSIPTLAQFKNMRDLRISKTDITGDNFGALNGMPLWNLNLEGTNLKEGCLAKIKSLPKTVTGLNLTKTAVGPADCAFIATCQNLTNLDLSGDKKITDGCIKEISKLKNLENLLLPDTSVTEASLPLLARMPKLKRLVVRYRIFWKIGTGKSPRSSLQIIDAVNDSRTPIDVFGPLHPNF